MTPFKRLLVYLFISIVSVLFSCKREVDGITGNEDDEGIDQLIASEKLNSVETSKPSRSELKKDEFEINQAVFSITDSIYPYADSAGRAKINLLINGPAIVEVEEETKKLQQQDAYGWIIKRINDQIIADKDKIFKILSLNGKYKEYDNSTKEASWGYYYCNKTLSKIGFDYQDGQLIEVYQIEVISDTSLLLNSENQTLELEPYYINGVY